MDWTIKWSDEARGQLKKLDKKLQTDIVSYLSKRTKPAENPRNFGKPLRYDKYRLWRYRVQDARIICQIRDKALIIIVLQVGHRRDVYDSKVVSLVER